MSRAGVLLVLWTGFASAGLPSPDGDGDGITDALDNCLLIANADQRDTDGDGFGNRCDADLDNSGGIVNFADLGIFRSAFGKSDAHADFDGSGGIVNFADLGIFRALFGVAPGPRGFCPGAIDELTSSGNLELVGDGVVCDTQSATTDCRVFRARILAPSGGGPADDPTLDDGLAAEAPILLAVRARKALPICQQRWVLFDNGGFGEGFGPGSGAAPGEIEPGGEGYGDDLIAALNDAGYATVDIIWRCADTPGAPCESIPGWVPSAISPTAGSAWYINTGATGYVGVGTRAAAIYRWAKTMAGGRGLCAHAQSSGSGRLAQVLTRFDGESLFEGIVFQGGPVFSDIPWMCSIDNGELGPRPGWFQQPRGALVSRTSDCARSPDPNTESCPVMTCRNRSATPAEALALGASSAFTRAAVRIFPATTIAVVIGGADTSDAAEHVFLWLRGHAYGGQVWPPIAARTLSLRQGYCEPGDASWNPTPQGLPSGNRPCAEWDLASFPTLDPASSGYDSALATLPHEIVSEPSGAAYLLGLHASICPP